MILSTTRSILILGAGIQGVCVALALRQRGFRVTLVDRMPGVLLRTSLRNEGKIHLGFVYANDPDFRTAPLLLRAALRFGPLLEEWLKMPLDWHALTSTPFSYLIMRDSMLAPKILYAHYERLQHCLDEMIQTGEPPFYLGRDLRGEPLWRKASVRKTNPFSAEHVAGTVETRELAVDREKLRDLLTAHLSSLANVRMLFRHRVETIHRTAQGFCVQGIRSDGSPWQESAETVVNCLWDGRLVMDEQLGISPKRAHVMRLKYRVLVTLPEPLMALPSVTMVLGRFGDIVRVPNAPTYLSWYPTCLRGWSTTIQPPPEWEDACAGNPPPELASIVARETLDAFDQIVPGLGASLVRHVDGGVIYSWGETDIDDHASALHQRHEIGFTEHDGYYSIDTGKFTCAPLFARQLADHLVPQ